MTDDQPADRTQPKLPAPRLALTDRYLPRVCAYPSCQLPPHSTWTITRGGHLHNRWWHTGDTMDLCANHEGDTGGPIRPVTPRERRR